MSEENKTQQSTAREAAEELKRMLEELLERKTREGIPSVYANTLHFENNELDFKILFGQLNQFPQGKPTVDWRTAVTMSWAEAKLLSYYLRINLAIYETANGNIKIPVTMFPPLPSAPADPDDRKTKEIFDFVQKLHRELLADLQKAP